MQTLYLWEKDCSTMRRCVNVLQSIRQSSKTELPFGQGYWKLYISETRLNLVQSNIGETNTAQL